MSETPFSKYKEENLSQLGEKSIQGLLRTSMINRKELDNILSTWEFTTEYGHPIPTLERESSLKALQPWLESMDIYSRGRFGGWKYEVGNMDHSFMQGVEWVNFVLEGKKEGIYVI